MQHGQWSLNKQHKKKRILKKPPAFSGEYARPIFPTCMIAITMGAIKILTSADFVVLYYNEADVAFTSNLVMDFDQANYEEFL